MKKILITFFTVLFCLTSSVGLTEQTSKNEKNKSLAEGILNTLKNSEVIKKHNKIKESNKKLRDNVRNYSIVIMNHISKKWIITNNFHLSKIKIFPMKVHLNSNGVVVDIEYVGENTWYVSNIEKSIIDSIKIAIQKSSPLPIPKDKRINVKKLNLDFNINLLTNK